jgi:hypothetical protein
MERLCRIISSQLFEKFFKERDSLAGYFIPIKGACFFESGAQARRIEE